MVNTKIRLIIFFGVEDGEALYSQQKQDQELTVAQIMNSLLLNSELAEKDIKTFIIHQKLVQNVPSNFIHDS